MKAAKDKADGLKPISKREQWKLLYLRFPLEGNGNGPEPPALRKPAMTRKESPERGLVHKR